MPYRSLVALLAFVPLAAQNTAPASKADPAPVQQPFRVDINEVIVPVTVTDYRGRFVSDLDVKYFKIFD